MTVQELFIKWLKHNNCYEQFMVNFKDWHRCISLDEYLNKYNYRNYVYGFRWGNPKEGVDYWDGLDIKWRWFCIKNIKFICKLEKI